MTAHESQRWKRCATQNLIGAWRIWLWIAIKKVHLDLSSLCEYYRRTKGEYMSLPSSLSLFSPCEETAGKPRLIGIARLASEGESIREGHNVEYFTLESKSVLNRCISRRGVPFEWTINPYRGCEFACKYCYARYTHEFMEMRDGLDFERRIYVKQHAANLLRQELHRVKPGESIALGTATDPYQPAERRYEVTRGILEEFARHRGFRLGIVTKSNLVERDLDLFRQVAQSNRLSMHITITTLNTELARILEPRAPRPDLRMDAVRALSQAGIRVGVSCSPVVPGITDSPKDLEAVVRAAAESGADFVFANPLFLKPCSAAVFLPFLEENFPHLAENYRQRYRDRAFLPSAYGKRLSELITQLRAKYKMVHYGRNRPAYATKLPVPAFEEQLDLF
jgi:DNA repair photolyase